MIFIFHQFSIQGIQVQSYINLIYLHITLRLITEVTAGPTPLSAVHMYVPASDRDTKGNVKLLDSNVFSPLGSIWCYEKKK